MPSFLNRLKKSITDDIKSGGSLLSKGASSSFDVVSDIVRGPGKKLGEFGLDALNYAGDLSAGATISRFADPRIQDDGRITPDFSLRSAGRGLLEFANPLDRGNSGIRRWNEAEQRAGISGGNPFSRLRNRGESLYESNLPRGAETAIGILGDPTMYIGPGSIGRLSLKAGRLGAPLRGARNPIGGLFEGVSGIRGLAGITAGASIGSELASRTGNRYDDMIAPLLGGALGYKGLGGAREADNALRSNVIRDSHGDVFRDLTTYLESNSNLPRKGTAQQWAGMLKKMGIGENELRRNGLDDLFKEKEMLTKEELLQRIKERDFDIEENIFHTNYEGGEERPGEILNRSATVYGDTSRYVPTEWKVDPGTHREIIIRQKPETKEPQVHTDSEGNVFVGFRDQTDGNIGYLIHNEAPGQYYFLGKGGGKSFTTLEEAIEAAKTDLSDANRVNPRVTNNQFNSRYPDILAHARVVDLDNGRTLGIPEIQSDWSQENRSGKRTHTTGRGGDPFTINEDKIVFNDGKEFEITRNDEGNYEYAFEDGEIWETTTIEQLAKNLAEHFDYTPVGEIPHPFQSNWQDLMLKRIIRYASENGYDQIRLATGEETLRIPGEELPIGSKEESGRLNAYNVILPRRIKEIAKKLGLQVEKSESSKSSFWDGEELTPNEIREQFSLWNEKYDDSRVYNFIKRFLSNLEDFSNLEYEKVLNETIKDLNPEPSVLNHIISILGGKIIELPNTPATVIKLTPDSRKNVLSKPQTMFGAISAEDENRFNQRMQELRRQTMDPDPEVARRAEEEMARLGEQRSQMESEPTKKIPRSAKLDELSDEELKQQYEWANNYQDSHLQEELDLWNSTEDKSTLPAGFDPAEDGFNRFPSVRESRTIKEKINYELIRRGSITISEDPNFFYFSAGIPLSDYYLNKGALSNEETVKVRNLASNINELKNGSKVDNNKIDQLVELFKKKFFIDEESYSKYASSVEQRRKAEGGRSFFDRLINRAIDEFGGQGLMSQAVDDSDPNRARRLARQQRLQQMRDEMMTPPQPNIDPRQQAGEMLDTDAAWAERYRDYQRSGQEGAAGPQAQIQPQAEGFTAAPRTPDQFNIGRRPVSNEITELGRPTGPQYGDFTPEAPVDNPLGLRTAPSSTIKKPKYGDDSVYSRPNMDEPKTLRDYLNAIIWRDPNLSKQDELTGGLKGSERQRKDQIKQRDTDPNRIFRRPQVVEDFGNPKRRAQELLENLSPDELDAELPPDTDFAEFITALVKSREMDSMMTARRAEAVDSVTGDKTPATDAGLMGGRTGATGPTATSDVVKRVIETPSTGEAGAVVSPTSVSATKGTKAPKEGGIFTPPEGPVDPKTGKMVRPEEKSPTLKFIGNVVPMAEILKNVQTIDDGNWLQRFGRQLAGKLGVNPSVLLNSDIGRIITAKYRQDRRIEELVNAAMSVIDVYGSPKDIGLKNGMINGIHWNDIASNIGKYKSRLTPEQVRFFEDINQLVQDIRTLRSLNGVEVLPREINGKLWVPRQVKGVRGIEITRPTNHKLKRLYDEATEGVKAGINYDDPRNTLKMYLYDSYREVVNEQFAKEIEKVTLPIDNLIDKRVKDHYLDSLSKRDEQLAKLKEAAEMYARDPSSKDAKRILKQQKAIMHDINNTYARAEHRLKEARATASKQEKYRSIGYDKDGKEIPVTTFNISRSGARVMSPEEGKLLHEYIGVLGYVPKQQENPITRGLGIFGRSFRQATSTTDLAAPFTHLLPLMFNNPKNWARAAAGQYKALIDPGYKSRYMEDNLDVINRMAAYGVGVGTTEYREVTGSTSEIRTAFDKTLGKVPVAGKIGSVAGEQSLGRFQTSMETALLIARVETWKSWEKAFAKRGRDPEALAQFVRNLTGGLDSRDLMVNKGQRDIESLLLAFSPKLFRSTVALGGMALKPNTYEGRAALQTLALMAGFAAGLFYTANYFINGEEAALESINPLSPGRKFLAIKVPAGGFGFSNPGPDLKITEGYYGVGGQVRAISQLIAKSAEVMATGNPMDFFSNDRFENPLLSFYTSRGAPAVTFGQDLIEATTGANANPYEDIDGLKDFMTHSAGAFLPFAAQEFIERKDATALFANLNGIRTAPFTRSEETELRLQSMGYTDLEGNPIESLDQLNREQRRDFFEKYPVEQVNKDDNITKMFNLIEEAEQEYINEVNSMSNRVELGRMSKEDFRNWYNERTREKFARISQIKNDFSVMPADRAGYTGSVTDYINSRNTTPEDQAVNEWYNISANTPLKEDGTVDFDEISKRKTELLKSLTPAQRAYVERQTNKESQVSQNQLVTEYDIVKDIVKPYFEAYEDMFTLFKDNGAPFMSQFSSYSTFRDWVEQTGMEMGITGETLMAYLEKKIPEVKKFNTSVTNYRRALKLNNPFLDRALADWYGVEPSNRFDYILSGYGSDEGAAMSPIIYEDQSQNNRTRAAELAFKLRDRQPRTFNRRYFHRPTRSLDIPQN